MVAYLVTVASMTGSSWPRQPFRVIQLNLCDSGLAGCYTGRAVAEAAGLIRAEAPDLVTLNGDRRTGGAYPCRNGQPYGIGLLAHLPTPHHVIRAVVRERPAPTRPAIPMMGLCQSR